MKVKVTNPMLKALKKAIPEFNFSLIEMQPEKYQIEVSYDLFANTQDYNPKTSRFKTIKITYPPEYYAMPRYITTNDLIKAFKASDHTLKGFLNSVKAAIEI